MSIHACPLTGNLLQGDVYGGGRHRHTNGYEVGDVAVLCARLLNVVIAPCVQGGKEGYNICTVVRVEEIHTSL